MSVCDRCGNEVPKEQMFCDKCGTRLIVHGVKVGTPSAAPLPPLSRYQQEAPDTTPHRAPEDLSLWGYYIKCFKNYTNCKGRARRKEYWGFGVFNLLIALSVAFTGGVIGGFMGDEKGGLGTVLYWIYCMIAFAPGIAVLARRLHDTGKSGASALWVFVPIVGWVYILVLLVKDSDSGVNEYGPNPKHGLR